MELNHKIYGEGDPIIILHGLFGMLDNWQTIAKRLATTHMVILVDQRDHGKSPHTSEFDYPTLAADLKEFMDQQWIFEAIIIGHSMGGKTAMQFAHDYPDAVERLIVVDIAPVRYQAGHQVIFEALHSVPIASVQSRSEVEEYLSKHIDDQGVRLFLMKNLRRRKEGGYAWKMNLALLTEAYPSILERIVIDDPIECPSLFVYGNKSNYVRKDEIKVIQDSFIDPKFAEITAGHWVHAEAPNDLMDVLRPFLTS